MGRHRDRDRGRAPEPNRLYTGGRHEERENGTPCGHVTDIETTGCNYLLQMPMQTMEEATTYLTDQIAELNKRKPANER
jgi:hypothetical protein